MESLIQGPDIRLINKVNVAGLVGVYILLAEFGRGGQITLHILFWRWSSTCVLNFDRGLENIFPSPIRIIVLYQTISC